jgi:hypothetical protein
MERSLYQRIVTRQGPVEFLDIGTGTPILYFHGSGAGAEVAPLLEQPLLDDGFRLIVPNRPGYFGTTLQSGRTSTGCAELAVGILDHLKIDHVAVIGMSSGGMAPPRLAIGIPTEQPRWFFSLRSVIRSRPLGGCHCIFNGPFR